MIDHQQPPWHFGLAHADQTYDWLPTDSLERFEENMRVAEYRKYFHEQGWLEPGAITYKLNKQGFRCDDFDLTARSLVALGCSYTVGTGLPLKDIWPTVLADKLNLVPYNLAWGGNSADTCFRLAEYWIPRLKPELVVMLAPPQSRIELLTGDNNKILAETFLPMSESGMFSDHDIYLKNWFANEENARINSIKNRWAVEKLCADLGIKCLTYEAHRYMAKSREEVGYARDRLHGGPIAHQQVVDAILRDYYGR